ncbi:unannotated protein [freshwater metagenome]|uniref:Unannotated protein n=1 Tax=freshwater metagenome TaxID=449393 RepID=A0A6J7IUP8_9ZZZZ
MIGIEPIVEHRREYRTHVGGEVEVAAAVQRGQRRRIARQTAVHVIADHEHDGRRAVIGASRVAALDPTTELGVGHDNDPATEGRRGILEQRLDAVVEILHELRVAGELIAVRVVATLAHGDHAGAEVEVDQPRREREVAGHIVVGGDIRRVDRVDPTRLADRGLERVGHLVRPQALADVIVAEVGQRVVRQRLVLLGAGPEEAAPTRQPRHLGLGALQHQRHARAADVDAGEAVHAHTVEPTAEHASRVRLGVVARHDAGHAREVTVVLRGMADTPNDREVATIEAALEIGEVRMKPEAFAHGQGEVGRDADRATGTGRGRVLRGTALRVVGAVRRRHERVQAVVPAGEFDEHEDSIAHAERRAGPRGVAEEHGIDHRSTAEHHGALQEAAAAHLATLAFHRIARTSGGDQVRHDASS